MKKHVLVSRITLALIILTLLVSGLTMFTILTHKDNLSERIQTAVAEQVKIEVEKIKVSTPLNGIDGYTPVKGKDYFDGKDGEKGDKGDSAYRIALKNGFKGTEKEWLESLKPKVRCNILLNRWETKYSNDITWQAMDGKKTPCIGIGVL